MIDTIEFSIHDLKSNSRLADFLHRAKWDEGLTKKQKGVDQERDLPSIKMKDYTYFHETGNEIEQAYFNKLKSYNYEIAYKIDHLKDRIEFNISIPKYLYSTNVFLFLPTYDSLEYYSFIETNVKNQLLKIYPYLMKFFKFFFAKEFGSIEIDNSNIEITRLDMCYNFLFRSENESKTYLSYLKRSRKKFQRKDSKATQYESSVYFPQKNMTFKIYHKLPEFLKHDLKHLKKQAEEKGQKIKSLDQIQDLASRTIRYEIEFRKPFFNYVFKNHIFRKNDPIWKEAKELWRTKQDKRIEFEGSIKNIEVVKFNGKFIPLMELPKKQKKLLRYADAIMNKRFTFWHDLQYDKIAKRWSESSLDWIDEIKEGVKNQYSYYQEQRFSKELFEQCVNRFYAELKHFHVTYANEMFTILQRVKKEKKQDDIVTEFYSEMNKQTGKKAQPLHGISIPKLEQILLLLQKYSFDQILKDGLVPRRTLMRYKSLLKQFNINDNVAFGSEIKKENNLRLYDYFIKDNLVLTHYLLNLPYELRQTAI